MVRAARVAEAALLIRTAAKWPRLAQISLTDRAQRAMRRNAYRLSARHNRLALARRLMRDGTDFLELARFYSELVQAPGATLPFLVQSRGGPVARTLFEGLDDDLDIMNGAIETLAAATGLHPVRGRHFVDVGANIGTTSVYAAKLFEADQVTALEPSPGNVKLARCNAILNEVADRVTVRQCAVTNINGTVEIGLSANQPGDHRVVTTGVERYGQSDPIPGLLKVDAIRLDNLEVDPSSVGLIWMDTQGHEGQVLDGAGALLRAGAPLITEYWPAALQRAGGLDLFEQVLVEHYTHFADAVDDFRPRPIGELTALRSTYMPGAGEPGRRGQGWTDLTFWRAR